MNESVTIPDADAEGIVVAVLDETYGFVEGSEWQWRRKVYRRELEAEFGTPFFEADIAPAGNMPAFVTSVRGIPPFPLWMILGGAFFSGQPLHSNLWAWRNMAEALRLFFYRPVFLNHQGAAVLAVDAVVGSLNSVPSLVRLIRYQTSHIMEDPSPNDQPFEGISDPRPTIFLGLLRHIFVIDADDQRFSVSVEGRKVDPLRLD